MIDDIAVDGQWFRHVRAGAPPFARPDPLPDARWQRGSVVDAIYFADEPDTVWAEWYRWLAEHGLLPSAGLPRDLWRIAISLERVADLRTTSALRSIGLPPPQPSGSQWPSYQAVGEQLAADGYDGVLSPSAARPTGIALCVFWPPAPRRIVEPHPAPTRIDDPPVPPRGMRT